MSSEQLERGLQASVKIYTLAQSKLDAAGDAGAVGAVGAVSREELVAMKRASAAMNRALTALVRESHDAQNRLTLELHMLRGIMQREHTDREANRAHVFELFRRYSGSSDAAALAPAPTSGAASTNPLNAPSASAVAVDRALAGLKRLEQSARELSPVGRVDVHGAGLLTAKLRLEEAAAAAAAKPKHKRPRQRSVVDA